MQSAPKPATRSDPAPHSATILPFRLRATRNDAPTADAVTAPAISVGRLDAAATVAAADAAKAILAKPERPTLGGAGYREWIQQALIGAAILHLIVFAFLQMQFVNDVERAANSGGAATAAGTVVLDVEVVAESNLPAAKKQTNMTAPDAKKATNSNPAQEQQLTEQELLKAIPPPAPVQAPVFALPQEETAPPQKAEAAPAPQSPTVEKREEPPKPEVKQVQKKRETKKKQQKSAKADPSIAAAPNRAAAANNNRGNAGANGRGQQNGRANASSYNALVLAHLQRYRVYPAEARSRGITGVSTVRFTLSRSGAVVSVSLSRGSGTAMLDQAALAMVRRASPFPAIPPGLGRSSMSFAAPIRFNLR